MLGEWIGIEAPVETRKLLPRGRTNRTDYIPQPLDVDHYHLPSITVAPLRLYPRNEVHHHL